MRVMLILKLASARRPDWKKCNSWRNRRFRRYWMLKTRPLMLTWCVLLIHF